MPELPPPPLPRRRPAYASRRQLEPRFCGSPIPMEVVCGSTTNSSFGAVVEHLVGRAPRGARAGASFGALPNRVVDIYIHARTLTLSEDRVNKSLRLTKSPATSRC
jgi:hypothetical protein